MTPVFARLCAVLRRFSLGKKSFTVAALGYIGPGDAALGGDFTLGQRVLSAQAVAQADDHGLPLVQAILYALPHPDTGLPGIQIVQHIVVHADDVHQGEGAAVPVCLQRVRQGYLPLELFPAAEVHQNFICYPLLTAPQGPLLLLLQGFPLFDRPRLASPILLEFWETHIHTPSRTAPHGRPSHPK